MHRTQFNNHINLSRAETKWSALILILSVISGGFVRLYPVIMANFPIHDGGLFYGMINDLIANNFRLPIYASYNQLQIPYTYPPLAFYFYGLLTILSKVPLENLVRMMPAIISTLSVPSFYFLGKTVLQKGSAASLATIAFAFLPCTYSWYIMGGGVTRSFAMLFFILASAFTYRVFKNPGYVKTDIALSALFHCLSILAHPEGALQTTCMGLFFLICFGLNKSGISKAMIIALLALIGASIWMVPVLKYHGLKPFLSVINVSEHSFRTLWFILIPGFTEEQNITLFSVFALIGVFISLKKKRFFLVIWFPVPILVETRCADGYSIVVMALLSGVGIHAVLSILMKNPGESPTWLSNIEKNSLIKIMLAYLFFLGLVNAFSFSQKEARFHLQEEQLIGIHWIRENTPPDAELVTLTGTDDTFCDPFLEWIPVLSERENITTLQGREWLLGADFETYYAALDKLQDCLYQDLSCLDAWFSEKKWSYDYIVIQSRPSDTSRTMHSGLEFDLLQSDRFQLVFENESIRIYKNQKKGES